MYLIETGSVLLRIVSSFNSADTSKVSLREV